MRINFAAMFFPGWVSIWFLVVAVAVAIMGFRRAAITLAAVPLIDWIISPIVAANTDRIPAWVLVAGAGIVALVVLNSILTVILGKEAAGNVVATYFVRLMDYLMLTPFRIIRAIKRTLFE